MNPTTEAQEAVGYLEESHAVKSSSRLVHVLSFLACIVFPLFIWGMISIINKKMEPIDSTVSLFCLGAFGTATTGKTIQTLMQK